MPVWILRASRGVVHSGDPVSAPIDLVFDDRVDSSCWTRAPRPFKGRLLSFNIAALSLLLAWAARAQIGVAVGFALAGIVGWFIARAMGMRPLHRLDGEVRDTTTAASARSLLGSLRERKLLDWFAPANFTPLMEGRLQLRIGDFRAAAAAYARAAQASVAPEVTRSMQAAQAHALVMAGDHKEALSRLNDLGDLKDFDPQVRLDLAIAKLSAPGSMRQVVDELEALGGGLASHPRALAAKSLALHREGQVDAAIDCFDQLSEHERAADPVVDALVKRARKSLRSALKTREKAARHQQGKVARAHEATTTPAATPCFTPAIESPATQAPAKGRKGKRSKSDKRANKEARRRARQQEKEEAKAAKHAARQAMLAERAVAPVVVAERMVPEAKATKHAAPPASVRTPIAAPSLPSLPSLPSRPPLPSLPSLPSRPPLPSLPSLKKLSDDETSREAPSRPSAASKVSTLTPRGVLAGLPPLRAAKPTSVKSPSPKGDKPVARAVAPPLTGVFANPLGTPKPGQPPSFELDSSRQSPGVARVQQAVAAPAKLPSLQPPAPLQSAVPASAAPVSATPGKAPSSLRNLPPIPATKLAPATVSPAVSPTVSPAVSPTGDAPKPAGSAAAVPSWASLLDDLPSAPAPSAPAPSAPKDSED